MTNFNVSNAFAKPCKNIFFLIFRHPGLSLKNYVAENYTVIDTDLGFYLLSETVFFTIFRQLFGYLWRRWCRSALLKTDLLMPLDLRLANRLEHLIMKENRMSAFFKLTNKRYSSEIVSDYLLWKTFCFHFSSGLATAGLSFLLFTSSQQDCRLITLLPIDTKCKLLNKKMAREYIVLMWHCYKKW